MEPDDLLCSRNARPEKALVGRAQWKINQPPSLRDHERAWKREGERPGALLARRTRTIRMCSFDARSEGQPWPLPIGQSGGSRKAWHEDSDDAAASGQRLGGMVGEELTECERDRFRKGA